MGWIILGIVFLAVTVWSLKGTTIVEYHYKNRVSEQYVPVWVLLFAFAIYCIPVMGILAFIAYLIMFSASVIGFRAVSYAIVKSRSHRCGNYILRRGEKE